MNRPAILAIVLLGGAILGASIVVDVGFFRIVVAGVLALAIVLAASPIREVVLLGWFVAAPYWQEVARSTPIGTMLNNGAYLFAGVGVVLWAIGLIVQRSTSGRLRFAEMLPGLVALLAFGSLTLGDLLPPGWTKADMIRQWYGNLVLPIAAYYVMRWGVHRAFVPRWFTGVWVTSIGISALTVAERWFGYQLWPYYRWQAVDIGRSVGPLANPAVLGTVLGISIAAAVAYIIWCRESIWRIRLAWASVLIAIPALWYTYARASLIAVVIAVALIAAFKSQARYTLIGTVVLSIVLMISAWGLVEESSVVNERFGNVSNAQVRVLLTAWSMELAAQRPILGWGYGSFDAAKTYAESSIADIPTAFASEDTSHNTLLTVLVELGLLGTLPLLWAILAPVHASVLVLTKSLHRDWRLFAVLGGLVVYGINALFIDMRFFSFPALIAWMLLGMLCMILEQSEVSAGIGGLDVR